MKYDTLAEEPMVRTTKEALVSKHIDVTAVKNGDEALEIIRGLIPKGSSVMNGASKTLEQIGFVDYLKEAEHGWINLHEKILEEKDLVQQSVLRHRATLSDFYVGSVHALIENGDFVVVSNTGSQLPNIVYSSPNLIFVVSTKKIVPTLDEAMKRIEEYVIPLENKRMMDAYGMGTALNKILIFKNENPMMGRKIHMILVEESLGF